jgi:hypothetical protein
MIIYLKFKIGEGIEPRRELAYFFSLLVNGKDNSDGFDVYMSMDSDINFWRIDRANDWTVLFDEDKIVINYRYNVENSEHINREAALLNWLKANYSYKFDFEEKKDKNPLDDYDRYVFK